MGGPVSGFIGGLGPWELILIAGILGVPVVSFLVVMWILRREKKQR